MLQHNFLRKTKNILFIKARCARTCWGDFIAPPCSQKVSQSASATRHPSRHPTLSTSSTSPAFVLSDAYMFHQANVIPTPTPVGEKSLLEYWYEVVLERMARYLNLQGDEPFPVKVGGGAGLSIAPAWTTNLSCILLSWLPARISWNVPRMAVFEADQPDPHRALPTNPDDL